RGLFEVVGAVLVLTHEQLGAIRAFEPEQLYFDEVVRRLPLAHGTGVEVVQAQARLSLGGLVPLLRLLRGCEDVLLAQWVVHRIRPAWRRDQEFPQVTTVNRAG